MTQDSCCEWSETQLAYIETVVHTRQWTHWPLPRFGILYSVYSRCSHTKVTAFLRLIVNLRRGVTSVLLCWIEIKRLSTKSSIDVESVCLVCVSVILSDVCLSVDSCSQIDEEFVQTRKYRIITSRYAAWYKCPLSPSQLYESCSPRTKYQEHTKTQ